MPQEHDDFEGIDISGPWGGVRIGGGGARFADAGGGFDDNPELRAVRRRVRQRLEFTKQLAYFVVIVGGLAVIDGLTGGGWWVQWVALIWGAFLVFQFLGTFVGPLLWSRDAEERMVQREMERRRGRVSVRRTPPDDGEG